MKPRVLLVYVNSMMDNLIPLNISYLTACLKENGCSTELFDTTFYRTSEKSSDEARVETLQVKPFDLSEYGINYKETDVFDDFRKKVAEFKPRVEWTHLELDEIMAMDQAGWGKRFKGSCMERVKLEHLQQVAGWCRENIG